MPIPVRLRQLVQPGQRDLVLPQDLDDILMPGLQLCGRSRQAWIDRLRLPPGLDPLAIRSKSLWEYGDREVPFGKY